MSSFKKIRVFTDSVGDIPDDLLKKWNIGVIPTYVNFDGKSYADDGKELDRDEFYRKIPQMKEFPTTAAPSPAVAEQMLLEGIKGYDHIVSVNIPPQLSTTINNVKLGAQALPEGSVTILDSGSLTMASGYQALVAAEVAAATGDVQQVVDAVARAKKHIKLYALIADLDYLRRSGRVNAAVAFAGSLLQLKLILDVHDGLVEPVHRIRTFKKAVDKLKEVTRAQAPLDRLVIMHIQNEEGAAELKRDLSDILPPEVITIVAGPSLGTHIGPGSLGVVTLNAGWRKK